MGMVKRYMMNVQEQACQAFDEGSEVNPYKGTAWEQCWQEAYDAHADNYGEYLDAVQAEEDYLRAPASTDYFDHLDRPNK